MSKNIIFCADGTWNDPNQDENADSLPDYTNVYKLFLALCGELDSGTLRSADEQEKQYTKDGQVVQVAKYIHGVGDSKNIINKIMGGAFGAGVISRIVRGYTYISREYQPGDKIYIVGFSRGAYTARALTGLICSQGLLAKSLTSDKEQAYRYGAKAWYRYRNTLPSDHNILAKFAEVIRDLPAFISSDTLKDENFIKVDTIAAVGVWDTVGAMGIPEYKHGTNHDSFRFADTNLSEKVANGFHAVSRDEEREVFSPTLWTESDRVSQLLFPGAHADVGGGYPQTCNESGLSDIALEWMMTKLETAGINFCKKQYLPNPAGTAHKPWAHSPWNTFAFPHGPRGLDGKVQEHESVQARRYAALVIAGPGERPSDYK